MIEPITIAGCDIDLTIKFVREVAAEKPDHRNLTRIRVPRPAEWHSSINDGEATSLNLGIVESACYFAQGQPSCIIGHAIHRQGVEANDLDVKTNTNNVIALTGKPGRTHSDPRVRWLREVQRNQDKGVVWQQAVRLADSFYPEVRP